MFCLYCRRNTFTFAKRAKAIERDGKRSGFESGERRLKIHENEYFLLIISAPHDDSFFVLCPLLDCSLFLLKVEFQIIGASEIQFEWVKYFVSFVANEEADVHVVAGGVEIVEWAKFAADLQMFILE